MIIKTTQTVEVETELVLPNYFKRNNSYFYLNEEKGIYTKVTPLQASRQWGTYPSIKVDGLNYIKYETLTEIQPITIEEFKLALLQTEQEIQKAF